jgi:hypothetical protein
MNACPVAVAEREGRDDSPSSPHHCAFRNTL